MASRYFDLCPYHLTGFPEESENSSRCANRVRKDASSLNLQFSSHISLSKSANGVTFAEVTPGPGAAPGKPKNARICTAANCFKALVNEPTPLDMQTQGRVTTSDIGCQKGGSLLDRPTPTASIPHPDTVGRSPVVTDDSLSMFSGYSGLSACSTLCQRESSAEVTNDAHDDEITAEEAPRLTFSCLRPSFPTLRSPLPHELAFNRLFISHTIPPWKFGDNTVQIPLSNNVHGLSEDDEESSVAKERYQRRSASPTEAHIFIQQMNQQNFDAPYPVRAHVLSPQCGEEQDNDASALPISHEKLLSTFLKVHQNQQHEDQSSPMDSIKYPNSLYIRNGSFGDINSSTRSLNRDPSRPESPRRKWWEKQKNRSPSPKSLPFNVSGKGSFSSTSSQCPTLVHSGGSECFPNRQLSEDGSRDDVRLKVYFADVHSRQRYLLRLCKALMKFGAPTHRLEEYMSMTSKVLDVDAQFLYIPGCMVVSFDEVGTHATDVKLVKAAQGVDLGRLFEVHKIYKEVVHDVIGIEKAIEELDSIMKRKPKFNVWFLILMHGCASASVGPFAFGARPIDMPVAFILGCLLGILQLVLSPRSYLYSNVFEITAAVLTSFLARAFGSIPYNGSRLFCFSALAQSSIALILPGYMVLCGSLELQSRSIVAGSVRMVYSIIYSLFLGFGITIGTSVYGLLDTNATSDYICPPSPIQNPYLQRLPFVLMFTFCLTTINQSKWRQIPMMLLISFFGYLTTYLSTKRFGYNTQVVNALGAFVIGVMGNLYSRLGHGLAAAAILPAIFVQVPSGLAASGSLVSSLTSADEISHNTSFYSIINNGTQGFLEAQQNISVYGSKLYSGVVFDIGFGMVQVAIGITVGLFLAALVVYPLGKKRSGLFSF
ncbi:putative DUF1212 domain membrane protein Prm10 [Talaromyces proteolyticus]|uniref:DUF1212 domain membrane protein Prm10 n=1 Tax=Talaromyces proteolyticus TaxID=1131652 RepID=A0AAD4PYC0_9EURO|nr:putative DUF1212 domain membrane protein Prm10 [Talaromyces proteolyticus]KAH8695008.1 putative DUF1212 domain membrane protein Prm10 [Talaromyces proteolyticus]